MLTPGAIMRGMTYLWGIFRAYWKGIVIPFCIVLVIAITIQWFKDDFVFSKWLFEFLSDWAIVLSAFVTFLLAFSAFVAISNDRHQRNIDRKLAIIADIRKWAEFAIEEVRNIPDPISSNPREAETHVRNVASKALSVMIEANNLGGELKTAVNETTTRFKKLRDAMGERKHLNVEKMKLIMFTDFTNIIRKASEMKFQYIQK